MSSIIQQAFVKARRHKKCAFIPFITGGFPNSRTFAEMLKALDDSGADVIEVGIPFSDPLADGPIIQHSSKLALDSGVTPLSILETLKSLRGTLKAPLVVMSYWNPIMKIGPEKFASFLKDAGVSGAIVPDLTPEESEEWRKHAAQNNIDTIFMVAPTTSADRMKKITSLSKGFVYLVSMTGVTGSGLAMNSNLEQMLREVKNMSELPVAVGFGVSTAKQAAALADYADGVIVGSALVKRSIEAGSDRDAINSVQSLASEIAGAIKLS